MVQPGRESWKCSGTSTPHMCHCRHRLAPCRCMAAAQPHVARPHASLCAVEHGKTPARAQELVCGHGTEGPGKGVGPVGPDPPPRDRGAHDAVAGEEDEDEQDDTCRQDVWVGRHGHGCLLDFCHQRPVILQPSRFPAMTATAALCRAGQGRRQQPSASRTREAARHLERGRQRCEDNEHRAKHQPRQQQQGAVHKEGSS